MLQWNYDERIDVQGILQSKFLQPVRLRLAEISEVGTCTKIYENLKLSEKKSKMYILG